MAHACPNQEGTQNGRGLGGGCALDSPPVRDSPKTSTRTTRRPPIGTFLCYESCARVGQSGRFCAVFAVAVLWDDGSWAQLCRPPPRAGVGQNPSAFMRELVSADANCDGCCRPLR